MCSRCAISAERTTFPARFYLGRSLEVAGYLDQAIEVYREMVAMVDVEMEHLASLGSCLALVGRHDEAEQIENRLTEARARRYITPFYFALLASGRRDADRTIAALTEAADDHASRIAEIHADPRFEWLHDDERFRELVARVGLSPLREVN